MSKEIKLVVDGEIIAMNEFVRSVFQDVITALMKNLRGLEEIKNISSIEIKTE